MMDTTTLTIIIYADRHDDQADDDKGSTHAMQRLPTDLIIHDARPRAR